MDIEEIKKVNVAPNDVLVVRAPFAVSLEMLETVKAHFNRIFPDNKVIILDKGATLDVLTREQIDA